jgi:hypothetical protein
MHGSDTIWIAREGLPRGGLIPLEERGEVALWPSQVGALAPCQRVFEVAPPPCKRVQLWTNGDEQISLDRGFCSVIRFASLRMRMS